MEGDFEGEREEGKAEGESEYVFSLSFLCLLGISFVCCFSYFILGSFLFV